MPAKPSRLNVIVGVIAVGIFVARLVAAHILVPPAKPAATDSYRWEEGGHSHKADRMPLFHAAGRSVTTTTAIELRGAAGSDNTTFVAKNVSPLAHEAKLVGVVVTKPTVPRADHQDRDRPGHDLARRRLAVASE